MVADPFPAKAAPAAMGQTAIDRLIDCILRQLNLVGAETVFPFRAHTGAIGAGAKYLFKGPEMGIGAELGLGKANGGITKGGALAKARHIAAQIIDPDGLGAALLLVGVAGAALLEEEHIGLDSLGVEDAGGQAQYGVQVALFHQVAAHLGADQVELAEDAVNQPIDSRLAHSRWRCFSREWIRDHKGDSLDISWLKDKDSVDAADLPEPLELANEAKEELEAALAELQNLVKALEGVA